MTEHERMAATVGDHLMDQVHNRHPYLSEPIDTFGTAVVVAETTGSETAFETAWQTLESQPLPGYSPQYEDFVNALVRHQQTDNGAALLTLAEVLPDHQTQTLVQAAEVTTDERIRTEATEKAAALLFGETGKSNYFRRRTAGWLIARLGIVNKSADLIDTAIGLATQENNICTQDDIMRSSVQALRQPTVSADVRTALLRGLTAFTQTDEVYPFLFVRNGVADVVTDDELRHLVKNLHNDKPLSIHGEGRRRPSIVMGNSREFEQYRELSSATNAWNGVGERFRYARAAAKLRRDERKQPTRRAGDTEIAEYYAGRLCSDLGSRPNLADTDKLTIEYQVVHFSDKHVDLHRYIWSSIEFGLRNSTLPAHTLPNIYRLRDSLPNDSAARVELNSLLHDAGDSTALQDSVRALTDTPTTVMSKLVAWKETNSKRVIDLFTYQFELFQKLVPPPTFDVQ